MIQMQFSVHLYTLFIIFEFHFPLRVRLVFLFANGLVILSVGFALLCCQLFVPYKCTTISLK